ncbi:MAG: T9SS type A sorting domain-containing protein, partial [Bacteroidales bacterium]|nr:T9SS type A sorting domain-containing protein [Bacteroidales bacterium]
EICIDDCVGTITLDAAGGVAPFSYSIDDCATTSPAGGFTDLCSGDYTICADIAKKNDTDGENDFWNGGTHSLFDRYWRGNFTTEYLSSVDADANAGSKAMKLNITSMEGKNFRLRSVNVPAGDYTITFKAKTDAAGVGKAKIGFKEDPSTWTSLTDTYTEYSGSYTVVVNPNNGTTRLVVFYTCDPAVVGTQSYNIWIDDIEVKEGLPTSIDKSFEAEVLFYPNPMQSVLNVQTDANISNIEIYSLTGQLVQSDYTGNKQINVAGLSKGVYIVSVVADGQIIRKKITKQ